MKTKSLFLATFCTFYTSYYCMAETSAVAEEQNGGVFSMVLAGDTIIQRKVSVYGEPRFLRLIDTIRSADAAFANLEMLFHDYESYPMHENGGANFRADPRLVKELSWMGFDILSLANNHTGDYGPVGMRLTRKYVSEAGYSASGVGNSLREAREPVFFETPKGRVALISVSSTFTTHSRAGNTQGNMPAHPGLNPLRHYRTFEVEPQQYEAIAQLANTVHLFNDFKLEMMGTPGFARSFENDVWFLGNRFIKGEKNAVHTEPHPIDMREIAGSVSYARAMADYVIVSLHGHEAQGADINVPAEFLRTFAKGVIDAGADVVAGHGPHVLRGIEIYKDRPIFYSLGNFIFHPIEVRRTSEADEILGLDSSSYDNKEIAKKMEAFFSGSKKLSEILSSVVTKKSIVAELIWRDHRLAEIALRPIVLGEGNVTITQGRPVLADQKTSYEIIQSMQTLSKPFGTDIVFDQSSQVGRIKLR